MKSMRFKEFEVQTKETDMETRLVRHDEEDKDSNMGKTLKRKDFIDQGRNLDLKNV